MNVVKTAMGIFYNIFMILIYFLIFMGPFLMLSEGMEVIKTGVPKEVLPLASIGILGLLVYTNMKVSFFRGPFNKFPVLTPLCHIMFLIFVITDIFLIVLNGWAEYDYYNRTVAIILAISVLIVGRLFMSYWYTKHPISLKLKEVTNGKR